MPWMVWCVFMQNLTYETLAVERPLAHPGSVPTLTAHHMFVAFPYLPVFHRVIRGGPSVVQPRVPGLPKMAGPKRWAVHGVIDI